MTGTPFARLIVAFIVAVLVATTWGAIVQSQYNLSALASIGLDVDSSLRLRTTLRDIFSGFMPTYGGYVAAPALLVAFFLAGWVATRLNGSRYLWHSLAGALAILLAIPLVNYLAPVALLVGASRDYDCVFVMALGGALAGLLFAWLARPGVDRATVGVARRPTEP